ncbi:MAG: hypothetical protein RL757_2887 [Bacteroidota bacterium]
MILNTTDRTTTESIGLLFSIFFEKKVVKL